MPITRRPKPQPHRLSLLCGSPFPDWNRWLAEFAETDFRCRLRLMLLYRERFPGANAPSLFEELRCHIVGGVRQIVDHPAHGLVGFEYSIQIDLNVIGAICVIGNA